MAAATSTLIVAAVAAIGTGISAYGQAQQAKSANAIAQFNALQQEKEAKAQLLGIQTQSALQKQQAEANFKLRQAEANARNSNADKLENQALTQDRVDRINADKKRREYDAMKSEQRAKIAASGIVESTGTPLDILAETAGRIQASMEDDKYQTDVARATIFSEAQAERFGGKLALAGATLDKDSEVAAAALRKVAGRNAAASGIAQAAITRATGQAAKSAGLWQAAGTILSGAASAAGGISAGGGGGKSKSKK